LRLLFRGDRLIFELPEILLEESDFSKSNKTTSKTMSCGDDCIHYFLFYFLLTNQCISNRTYDILAA
jgi:hypothetical protein